MNPTYFLIGLTSLLALSEAQSFGNYNASYNCKVEGSNLANQVNAYLNQSANLQALGQSYQANFSSSDLNQGYYFCRDKILSSQLANIRSFGYNCSIQFLPYIADLLFSVGIRIPNTAGTNITLSGSSCGNFRWNSSSLVISFLNSNTTVNSSLNYAPLVLLIQNSMRASSTFVASVNQYVKYCGTLADFDVVRFVIQLLTPSGFY